MQNYSLSLLQGLRGPAGFPGLPGEVGSKGEKVRLLWECWEDGGDGSTLHHAMEYRGTVVCQFCALTLNSEFEYVMGWLQLLGGGCNGLAIGFSPPFDRVIVEWDCMDHLGHRDHLDLLVNQGFPRHPDIRSVTTVLLISLK